MKNKFGRGALISCVKKPANISGRNPLKKLLKFQEAKQVRKGEGHSHGQKTSWDTSDSRFISKDNDSWGRAVCCWSINFSEDAQVWYESKSWLIIIYNSKTLATTGLKKHDRQNRKLGILIGGMKVEGTRRRPVIRLELAPPNGWRLPRGLANRLAFRMLGVAAPVSQMKEVKADFKTSRKESMTWRSVVLPY